MRRTQAERREATIARLLDATIDALAERGYAGASVAEICRRAGLSQGALFRHFDTRHAVIGAATDEIGRRHLARFVDAFPDMRAGGAVSKAVRFVHDTARSPAHAAWHEVMVAARTDPDLRAHVRAPLERFEAALLRAVPEVLHVDGERAARLGVVFLSLAHMFDSEAVTFAVYPNPALEAARLEWATAVLSDELRALGLS